MAHRKFETTDLSTMLYDGVLMLNLPDLFVKKMLALFESDGRRDEFNQFLAGIGSGAKPGIRFNPTKGEVEEMARNFACSYKLSPLVPVPWTKDAYYLPAGFAAAQTVEYLQGYFYLQEASAMLPAALLQAKPGMAVLDLCAAPGGKTTKLAADMNNQGLLLANEINLERAKVLLRNLEQWGAKNVVLTNADAAQFNRDPGFIFDKILADVPCSGEGMFGRDPGAVAAWTQYQGRSLTDLQLNILLKAADLLAPKGEILYSTCTFNPEENEGIIWRFLREKPEFSLAPLRDRLPKPCPELSGGVNYNSDQPWANCLRVWPHLARGEGHFCALLVKSGEAKHGELNQEDLSNNLARVAGGKVAKDQVNQAKRWVSTAAVAHRDKKGYSEPTAVLAAAQKFISENFTPMGQQNWQLNSYSYHSANNPGKPDLSAVGYAVPFVYIERNFLHYLPQTALRIPTLHVLKRGVMVGEFKDGRNAKFVPSHALALTIAANEYRYCLNLPRDDSRITAYIAGQSIIWDQSELQTIPCRTYVLLLAESEPLGWLYREKSEVLKNLYPNSWVRRLRSPHESEVKHESKHESKREQTDNSDSQPK
ncbi:RsmF rRNA methyltransferase first C-terminal domain-containing protein [Mageeibacillus indolicus]|nr:RsmF rRNA methyltransferase first C-terminal domain-containing protein [Mageeibacillus indolicus]